MFLKQKLVKLQKATDKEKWSFACNKGKIVVIRTMHQNSKAISKALLENFKISDHKYRF